MSFLKKMFGIGSAASSADAAPLLPPGWRIIMNGTTPNYYHAGKGKFQTQFPQPEPEPERELPLGWRKQDFRGYAEYVNILDPHASSLRTFPTEPARRPLDPRWEEFTVGDTTMYRLRNNIDWVKAEFQPASDDQIAKMWEDYTRPEGGQWARGGKRKQSKRKQSKRKQSKRNQRKKSH